jgi:single-strand DNA-binding protein
MLNKVVLMGRLTKEPETRYTSVNNTLVCSFTLAVNRRFAKQGEEKQTDFIPIVAWSKLGEFCSKYFVKGKQVVIVGRIQTRNWDDVEGKRHYATEVIADEAYFADNKKAGETITNTSASPVEENIEGFQVVEDDELPF